MKICYSCYKNTFEGLSYLYHITIKPDPKKVDEIYKFVDYLLKKPVVFFLVKCKSAAGYEHFHGIISFRESQTIDNKLIKCIQRQVNRMLGFLTMDPLYSNLKAAYSYIRAENNTCNGTFEQEDFLNAIPEHCMIH